MIDGTNDNFTEDFMIGNTRIKITADFCADQTWKEEQEILKRIAQKVKPMLVNSIIIKSKT